MRLFLVVAAMGWFSGCSAEACRETCDGCCKQGICVPLAATSRTQCGRGGASCVNGEVDYCPVCDHGNCSTGLECFIRPPLNCECGSQGSGTCGFDCGNCSGGMICEDYRCVQADAGSTDGGP